MWRVLNVKESEHYLRDHGESLEDFLLFLFVYFLYSVKRIV